MLISNGPRSVSEKAAILLTLLCVVMNDLNEELILICGIYSSLQPSIDYGSFTYDAGL
jgi:hypothetical protein